MIYSRALLAENLVVVQGRGREERLQRVEGVVGEAGEDGTAFEELLSMFAGSKPLVGIGDRTGLVRESLTAEVLPGLHGADVRTVAEWLRLLQPRMSEDGDRLLYPSCQP